jgi:hypothetical protein
VNAIKSVLTSLDLTRAFAPITLHRGVAVVMALTMAWTTPALAKVSCERDGATMLGKPIDDTDLPGVLVIQLAEVCAAYPHYASCSELLSWFAKYGVNLGTLRRITFLNADGTRDIRFSPKQIEKLVLSPWKCSDGIPRLLVRLRAGGGLLGWDAQWLQFEAKFPEGLELENPMLGPPGLVLPDN